ncbi:MAG: PEP-CTERM sorting domain-containing protein [Phycisphaerae bacterium]|nr:PEP-CTERM sorting domain-containing protein [Phycisphaerae bacterium]
MTHPAKKNAIAWTLVVGLGLATSASSLAAEFYDDFDDGNWDGWAVYNPYGDPGDTLTPVLVPSPEGWAVQGVGSGYGSPEAAYLVHPLPLSGVVELSIEMRAKSGSVAPTHSTLALFNGDDYNQGYDYGENDYAMFSVRYDGVEEYFGEYPIDHEWHDFKWTRDAEGWWSLSIDAQLVLSNFLQDVTLTSFDAVALTVCREHSEIEWVRIVPEPATLSLLTLGGLLLARRRR